MTQSLGVEKVRVNMSKEEFRHAYSSQYYDPVKAHEYYERTKQLKGRSTSGMSDEQRSTWNVVKEGITSEKKEKTENLQEESNATVEALRSEAAAARQRISEKLRAWLEKIGEDASTNRETLSDIAKQQREEIQAEKQRKLDALPEIPSTASPSQKARMRESIAMERDSINAEAREKLAAVSEKSAKLKSDISEKASKEKSETRESSNQERQIVAENLKAAISSVREKVKEIKTALDASTEDTLNREYDNIMKNIAGKPAKTKKKSKSEEESEDSGDSAARDRFIAENLAKRKAKKLGG